MKLIYLGSDGKYSFNFDNKSEFWTRTPIIEDDKSFFIEVYVEGYRTFKDTWLHYTYKFYTIEDALIWDKKLRLASREEQNDILGLNHLPEDWYGITFEYTKIFELAKNGSKFIWERK